MDAIVYTSNTGSTKQYADMLGEEINLPVYALKDAKKSLAQGAKVIYLGWLMAGGIKGLPDAKKLYDVAAVCAVGMGVTGEQIDYVRERNKLDKEMPLFTLQGGYNIKALHGIYKFIMNRVSSAAVKSLLQKKDRTENDNIMLDLLSHGGSRVAKENLDAVLAWYKENA